MVTHLSLGVSSVNYVDRCKPVMGDVEEREGDVGLVYRFDRGLIILENCVRRSTRTEDDRILTAQYATMVTSFFERAAASRRSASAALFLSRSDCSIACWAVNAIGENPRAMAGDGKQF